jgi:pimeloyl-ACP methyl ester carboxylesterase
MWLPVMPALAASRRVIAGDHRGHGGSDKPGGPYTVALFAVDWVAAMDALSIARADLLGLSLGGAVAMRIAADHPARVGKLILLDTWGAPHPEFAAMLEERLRLLASGDVKAYVDAAIPQVFSADYVHRNPEAIEAYRTRAAQVNVESLRSAVDACLTHDMAADLRRISAPTLVLVGEADRLTPPFQAKHLASAIPGAQFHAFAGSAHFPNIETRDEFLARVEAFLSSP